MEDVAVEVPRKKTGRPERPDKQALKRKMVQAAMEGVCTSVLALERQFDIADSTISSWMKQDARFKEDLTFALRGLGKDHRKLIPDREKFRKDYFGHDTPVHQKEWFDLMDSHDISLILVPPEMGKTSAMVEECVYQIVKDRNVRIMYVCSNREEARKRLSVVQERLTDADFYDTNGLENLVRDFGPFTPRMGERSNLPWTVDFFTVTGRFSGEKDYSMQSLGLKGKIYGTRLDLIILDDIVEDVVSESERERHIAWILGRVQTRMSKTAKLVIIGTRVHEYDIYGQFLSEDSEWSSEWAKIVRPAINEAGESLWPEYWPVEELVQKRQSKMRARDWNLIYQQAASGMPDAPFSLESLERAKDPSFSVGNTVPGVPVVMGVDPALEGTLAITVLAVDRASGQRWLVDCIARTAIRHPDMVKNLLVETAQRYGASRCNIEKNAMQGFLSKDFDLRRRLLATGCQVEEEHTDRSNKFDPEWGVASVAAQIDAGMYHIPDGPGSTTAMRPLLEELSSWRPGARMKQDRVMSLWLAELAARRFGTYRPGLPTHNQNVPPWVRRRMTPRWVDARARRTTA